MINIDKLNQLTGPDVDNFDCNDLDKKLIEYGLDSFDILMLIIDVAAVYEKKISLENVNFRLGGSVRDLLDYLNNDLNVC